MYSNRKESALSTPFCTLSSGTCARHGRAQPGSCSEMGGAMGVAGRSRVRNSCGHAPQCTPPSGPPKPSRRVPRRTASRPSSNPTHSATSPPPALAYPVRPCRTLYSFISAGSTVKGAHVSATMAMATVVHTRFWRSCTCRHGAGVAGRWQEGSTHAPRWLGPLLVLLSSVSNFCF